MINYIKTMFDNVSVEGGIGAIRRSLTEIVVKVFCIIGIIAVVMGGIEGYFQGKTWVVFFYGAAYLPVLIAFLFRRKIPYQYRINIVLLALYALAVLILGGVGLSGAGIILLATFCVLAAAFRGAGTGLVFIGMSVGAILAVGWGMSSGRLPVDIVTMTNSTRPEAWIMAVILFILIVGIMVLCISLLQSSLQKTITTLQSKKDELQRTNKELETAVRSYREKAAALEESEEFHKRLFDESPMALCIQDYTAVGKRVDTLRDRGVDDIDSYLLMHGDETRHLVSSLNVVQANHSAVDLYKAGSEKALLTGLNALIQSGDCRSFIEQVVCFTSGNDRYEGETRIPDFQGQTLDLILRKTVLNRMTNGLSKILVSVVDVTDLYRAGREKQALEKQLQQTRKLETIGTLAGGIAHDFNNILFPISGHAEMLLSDIPHDSPYRKGIDQIYSGTLRAKELVKQIQSFSRQEPSELKIVKVQQIVNEVLKLIRATIPATIEIQQDIDTRCGPVTADPTQIHQVIMNLCTNAWHAMENVGGLMSVSLGETVSGEFSNHVCLTVRDSGCGINANIMDKIFDPFFTTKEKGRGTGMGLSVIHGIVSKMGGGVRVDSQEGKCTCFYVYFPLEKHEECGDPDREPVRITGGEEHILLIDDEKSVLAMETKMLERLGYEVCACADSLEALEIFRVAPHRYDLMISDVAMPRMGGDELALKILEIRPDIPILLVTGYSETVTETWVKKMGISGLLTKPVSMTDLDRNIRDIMKTEPSPQA